MNAPTPAPRTPAATVANTAAIKEVTSVSTLMGATTETFRTIDVVDVDVTVAVPVTVEVAEKYVVVDTSLTVELRP